MPLYDYTCRACGAKFDLLRKLSDKDEDIVCPECGEKQADRQISAATCTSTTAGFGSFSPGACTPFT